MPQNQVKIYGRNWNSLCSSSNWNYLTNLELFHWNRKMCFQKMFYGIGEAAILHSAFFNKWIQNLNLNLLNYQSQNQLKLKLTWPTVCSNPNILRLRLRTSILSTQCKYIWLRIEGWRSRTSILSTRRRTEKYIYLGLWAENLEVLEIHLRLRFDWIRSWLQMAA